MLWDSISDAWYSRAYPVQIGTVPLGIFLGGPSMATYSTGPNGTGTCASRGRGCSSMQLVQLFQRHLQRKVIWNEILQGMASNTGLRRLVCRRALESTRNRDPQPGSWPCPALKFDKPLADRSHPPVRSCAPTLKIRQSNAPFRAWPVFTPQDGRATGRLHARWFLRGTPRLSNPRPYP